LRSTDLIGVEAHDPYIRSIKDANALEAFTSNLADIVVGPEGHHGPGGGVLATLRLEADRLEELGPEVQRALVIYTMAAHGAMSIDASQEYLTTHWRDELEEFVSASVHSLIGRLFAIKAIEDNFCLGTNPPLIPQADWVFHTDRFDRIESSQLPVVFFAAIGG
jgi:hypothetical protein